MSMEKEALDVRELIPNEGDAVTIVNHGDTYQIIVSAHPTALTLTDEDVEALTRGEVTWQ